MPNLLISRSDPALPQNVALLEAHLESMRSITPPEAVHALDIEALRVPSISFWSATRDGVTLACGALKDLGDGHGEIKSMHTAAAARRQGVGRELAVAILAEAERRRFRRVSLETGSTEAFAPARAMYASLGFESCGPFGHYTEHPHSAFMTLELAPGVDRYPDGASA